MLTLERWKTEGGTSLGEDFRDGIEWTAVITTFLAYVVSTPVAGRS